MAHSFDPRVAYAIDNLWLHIHSGRAAEAKKKLEEAAADRDGDACYFLGRCYAGRGFISPEHGLPEDNALAEKYFNLSIEYGSAVGMFGSMRLKGFKPQSGSLVHAPYHSLQEVWDEVNEMAGDGDLFCKMMVANAYYYGDAANFLNKNASTVPRIEDFFKLEQEWGKKAIALYEYCIAHGLYMILGNLMDLYTSGDAGIPKQPEKALKLRQLGAEKGIGFCELAEGKEYYEKKTEYYLGEIYFYGGDGILPDYDRTFPHLLAAFEDGSLWGSDMLGTCYLKGLGTGTDYAKALPLFEKDVSKPMYCIGIGEIYAYGLGVKPDIRSAMVYWSNHPKDERVLANQKNFKRTLFWLETRRLTGNNLQ